LQPLPREGFAQITTLERNSCILERESVHFPGRRDVRASNRTRRLNPVHEVEHRSRLGGSGIYNLLKHEAGRRVTSPGAHLDFLPGRRFRRGRAIIKALRACQAVAFFQLLRELDRLSRLPFSMPNRAVQADPAGDDMDMVKLGVVMPDRDILVIRQSHPGHEVSSNIAPPVGSEAVARGERKTGVPHGTGNTRPRLPR
jgi:hypothetical protein